VYSNERVISKCIQTIVLLVSVFKRTCNSLVYLNERVISQFIQMNVLLVSVFKWTWY